MDSPAAEATPKPSTTAERLYALEELVAKQRNDIDTLTWLLADLLTQLRQAKAAQIVKTMGPKLQAKIFAQLSGQEPPE